MYHFFIPGNLIIISLENFSSYVELTKHFMQIKFLRQLLRSEVADGDGMCFSDLQMRKQNLRPDGYYIFSVTFPLEDHIYLGHKIKL